MLNARPIDKFYLSGGWQDLKRDAKMLAANGVKYVLDLQFTPIDEYQTMTQEIKDVLEEQGIGYDYVALYDSSDPLIQHLPAIFAFGAGLLAGADSKFSDPKDHILVKCGAGVSRSPSMLIAYYGYARKWSYQESLTYIRNKEAGKPGLMLGSQPNPAFSDYLKRAFGNDEFALNPDERFVAQVEVGRT